MNKDIENKIKGVVYGMALGDSMGMPSELWGKKKVREHFGWIDDLQDGPESNPVAKNYTKGQYTDDTAQALVVIDSLVQNNFVPSTKIIGENLLAWAIKENAFEENILGPTSKAALKGIKNNEDVSSITNKALSNGSAMRIAPVGCLFDTNNLNKIVDYVYEISKTTHSSDVAIAGASIIAVAVATAIETSNFESILENIFSIEEYSRSLGAETFSPSFTKRIKIGLDIAKEFKDQDKLFVNEIYDVLGAGVNIVESVSSAIAIAYYSKDVNHCAILCANLAGDTDTIGTMATAIRGGLDGFSTIKSEWVKELDKNNEKDLNEYANILINERGKKCQH